MHNYLRLSMGLNLNLGLSLSVSLSAVLINPVAAMAQTAIVMGSEPGLNHMPNYASYSLVRTANENATALIANANRVKGAEGAKSAINNKVIANKRVENKNIGNNNAENNRFENNNIENKQKENKARENINTDKKINRLAENKMLVNKTPVDKTPTNDTANLLVKESFASPIHVTNINQANSHLESNNVDDNYIKNAALLRPTYQLAKMNSYTAENKLPSLLPVHFQNNYQNENDSQNDNLNNKPNNNSNNKRNNFQNSHFNNDHLNDSQNNNRNNNSNDGQNNDGNSHSFPSQHLAQKSAENNYSNQTQQLAQNTTANQPLLLAVVNNQGNDTNLVRVPKGFEEVALGQTEELEVRLLGHSLGIFPILVEPNTVTVERPESIMAAIENEVPAPLMPNIKQAMLQCCKHCAHLCVVMAIWFVLAGKQPLRMRAQGCGFVDTNDAAAIHDTNNAELHLFFNKKWLPANDINVEPYHRISSATQNAFIHSQNVNVSLNRDSRNISVSGSGALGISSRSYIGAT